MDTSMNSPMNRHSAKADPCQHWISPLLTAGEYDTARRFAETRWPILIRGETGVGKEYLARWLHAQSDVASGPFVPVNCSALPTHLVESELLRYERGAFTGANVSSPGLVRAADGGTLFLDEIGELDPAAQSKLLRFLDSGEVRALSARKTHSSSARVLAATHVNLQRAVREGKFRLDLFERLSVFSVYIPALRERPKAISAIACRLLEQHRLEYDPMDLSVLTPLPWPGNIRQLRNALLRAAVLAKGPIRSATLIPVLEDLEIEWGAGVDGAVSGDLEHAKLREIEKDVVVKRLRKFGGNKSATADNLGIAKSTLHEMLRRWGGPAADVDFGGRAHDKGADATARMDSDAHAFGRVASAFGAG